MSSQMKVRLLAPELWSPSRLSHDHVGGSFLCVTPTNYFFSLLAVNLNHFRLLRVVGKGAFGKVRIVERKDSGLTFALKYIRKDEGTFTSIPHHGHLGERNTDC